MKIKITRAYIQGFGCLKDRAIEFSDGLFAVCSDNGSGKSTLIAFIKAMLFGIGDTKKTSLYENERRRYAPWDNGCFGGSLTIRADGRGYRIERRFGRRPSEDEFSLFDADTARPSADYGENIGEELLGIDKDCAERTLFLTERNLLPTSESPAISAALSGAVGNITEADRLGDATALLDGERRRYTRRGGGGELDSLRERVTELKRGLSALESLKAREASENEEIALVTKRLSELDEKKEGVKKSQTRLVGKRGARISPLPLILFFLCVATVPLGIFLTPLFYILAAALGVSAAALTLIGQKKRARAYTILDGERDELDGVRAALIEERAELIRKNEATADAIRELLENGAELAELTSRLDRLEWELYIIKEARERLVAASETLAKKHLGGATAAFSKYLSVFSESEGVTLDTELNITKAEGGMTHPYEAYSRGARDLYALAARLAAADAVFGGECPFLVFDDPFAAFDDKRLATALGFIVKLAEEKQVIYLTATKTRLPR